MSALEVQSSMFPDPAAEQYEAALAAYWIVWAEWRDALVEWIVGTLNRRDYVVVRDRCEEAAREMLRLRPCSETLDTP